MSNPDCDWYMSNNMDIGYCDDANNDEEEAQLYLADSQALAGNNVNIFDSSEFVFSRNNLNFDENVGHVD